MRPLVTELGMVTLYVCAPSSYRLRDRQSSSSASSALESRHKLLLVPL